LACTAIDILAPRQRAARGLVPCTEDACADGRLSLIGSLFSPPAPPGLRGVWVVAVGCRAAAHDGEEGMLDHLPASVAFCDVETTGLGHHDRIVSFGGIGMISSRLTKGRPDLEYLYLVFDPGMRNHRNAEQIHGFSDSALRLQDPSQFMPPTYGAS
jgi:hypothetical protein